MVQSALDEGGVPETEEEEERDIMGESWEALEMKASGWWRECVPSGEEHVLIWETAVLGQLHKGK